MDVPDFGGHPAIDFANSILTERGRVQDALPDLASVLSWLAWKRLVPEDTSFYQWHTGDAERTIRQVHELRALTRQILAALRDGRSLPSGAIPELNRWLGRSTGAIQIVTDIDSVYRLAFRPLSGKEADPLPLLAEIVASLLTKPAISERIQQCANPECGAFFLAGKRWCSMERCGNQMKARAYYERKRSR
jgi:predicted RNA-binding Zn ribbon-like protein